jgi:hypothetical protein
MYGWLIICSHAGLSAEIVGPILQIGGSPDYFPVLTGCPATTVVADLC